MVITQDFPGGNIEVVSQQGNRVFLKQQIRDTTLWWFYWCFCLKDAPDEELEFVFTDGEVVGPFGPAYSMDRINWQWLGRAINHTGFTYKPDHPGQTTYFCFSMPYQLADFHRFLPSLTDSPHINYSIMCKTEQGRELPVLAIGNLSAPYHVLLTCRHHACESTASYVLEGVLQFLTSYFDTEINNRFLFHIAPFMDLDGVENGDQGKCRDPYDHNRDYVSDPIYKSTAAIMDYCSQLNLVLFLDLHCPWRWNNPASEGLQRDEDPYFGLHYSPMRERTEQLCELLERLPPTTSLDIPYSTQYNLGMGEVDWMGPEEMNPSSFFYFANKGCEISTFLEFPYFGKAEHKVTQTSAREFGHRLAKALISWLTGNEPFMIGNGENL